jgi:hypothetical protein
MVAQILAPRKAAQVRKLPAKRVRQLLLELTYRLHATQAVRRLPIRSAKRELVAGRLTCFTDN